MARSKSDISNSAIRIFLQDVGKFYDKARGFAPYVPKATQKKELLTFFDHQCCYCGTAIDERSLSQDHLIPMNKEQLGLHAWGNVVPCCKGCNSEKQQHPWKRFLATKAGKGASKRRRTIERFVASKFYYPDLNLHEYADNLYADVGEVAATLIRLRYRQAEKAIELILKESVASKLSN
jgi:hypothetical protein